MGSLVVQKGERRGGRKGKHIFSSSAFQLRVSAIHVTSQSFDRWFVATEDLSIFCHERKCTLVVEYPFFHHTHKRDLVFNFPMRSNVNGDVSWSYSVWLLKGSEDSSLQVCRRTTQYACMHNERSKCIPDKRKACIQGQLHTKKVLICQERLIISIYQLPKIINFL